MRTLLKATVAGAAAAVGLLRRRHAGRLVVLTFHRVRPDAEQNVARPMRAIETTATDFRELLLWMRARYEPIALGDWISQKAAQPRPASFAVTFDDGWADNFKFAFPVLRELGIPATIFLATGAVEDRTPFWWQRPGLTDAEIERIKMLTPDERAARISQLAEGAAGAEFLTWEQIREMGKSGLVRFGAHGHAHELLDQVSREAAWGDIRKCWELVRAQVPDALLPALAWPNGNARDDLTDELTALGLCAGFGTQRGSIGASGENLWHLPRNDVSRQLAGQPALWNWFLLKS